MAGSQTASTGRKDTTAGSTGSQTAGTGSSKKDNTGNQTASTGSSTKDNTGSQTTNTKPDTTQQATTEAELKAVWVVDQAAYDEERPVYETKCRWICVKCGGYMYSQEDIDNHPCVSSWYSDTYDEQVGTETIHHDEIGHWEYR